MRLMIDGQRLTAERTGVGRCLETILDRWAETGLPIEDALIVLREKAGLARVPEVPGLETVVAGSGLPGLLWENLILGRLLRSDDLLFAPANLVPLTWRGKTLAVIYDTLPWCPSAGFPWHVKARFGWRYRFAAQQATRVIVPSQATADDVIRVHGISPRKITVVYPAPERRFQPLAADSPGVRVARESLGLGSAPFFLFVGKRSARRNVPAIVAAFAEHRLRFPEHRLVFVGPDGHEAIAAADSGVVNGGHVSEEVLHGLLASAIALLYPSRHEGFGLPVVEAQTCGCPVVTLKNSALGESGGDAAWYLKSDDSEAIANAMLALASDVEMRADFVARGLRNVRRFSADAFASQIRREIRLLAGMEGGANHLAYTENAPFAESTT